MFTNAPLLLAAGWEELIKILPFVIAILVWVINHFAGQVPAKPPQRGQAGKPPAPPRPKPANDPLQSEIDEFLRQAQAVRDGKQSRGKTPARSEANPQGSRPDESQKRPARRPIQRTVKPTARREEPPTS